MKVWMLAGLAVALLATEATAQSVILKDLAKKGFMLSQVDNDRLFIQKGSEAYICFSTTPTSFTQSASTSTSSAFTGQTNGSGPSGSGFTFPLCAVRRVERLNSQNFQVCRVGWVMASCLLSQSTPIKIYG